MSTAVFALALAAVTSTPLVTAPLPPALPWGGASRGFAVAADHPWATPAEASGLTTTPSAAETRAFLDRLAAANRQIQILELTRSAENRPVELVVVSQEGARDAAALRANQRPTLFVQAGIHAGEIDGKDAALMLLRDLTIGRGGLGDLLEQVNLLIIPILNIDGHERASAFSRPNQRGPLLQGWRTNARNLNLNRDFTKLDAAETRAVVRVLRDWPVDLWLDVHVTDGVDYEYDITFGWNGHGGRSPLLARWLEQAWRPLVDSALAGAGHVPGPLIFAADDLDPSKGVVDWAGNARFSNGYGDARHVASVLVENHSLKPFDQRVLGTRVLLEASARALVSQFTSLRAASQADSERRPESFVLSYQRSPDDGSRMQLRSVEMVVEQSAISGGPVPRWLGRPRTIDVPIQRIDTPAAVARRPIAWWLPPSAGDLLEILELHGVTTETIDTPREVVVEVATLPSAKLAEAPFEGRARLDPGAVAWSLQRTTLPAGSVRVPADQRLADLAAILLEPESPDSFLQWGFLLGLLQETEYLEAYVIEPLAQQMLAADAQLQREWEVALASDAALRADPQQRLAFFARRSAYRDSRFRVYPIVREPRSD